MGSPFFIPLLGEKKDVGEPLIRILIDEKDIQAIINLIVVGGKP